MTTTATREKARTRPDSIIEDRHHDVRRSDGRRRLRLLVVVFFACAIPASVYLTVRSPVLDVDTIDALATTHVSIDEIVEASGIHMRDPLVFVHAEDAARRITRAIPWVDRVRVQRRWPGTVRIRVTEYKPSAVLRAEDGTTAALSADGRVLERGTSGGAGFEITGIATTPPAGERLAPAAAAALPDQLPPALALRVVGLVLHGDDATLVPAPGAGPEIRLGNLTELSAKLAAAVAVIDRLGEDGLAHVTYIDVRVPSSPVAGSAAQTTAAATPASGPSGAVAAANDAPTPATGEPAGGGPQGLTGVPTSIALVDCNGQFLSITKRSPSPGGRGNIPLPLGEGRVRAQ